MTEDEIAVDYLSEILLLMALFNCKKDESLSDKKAKKVVDNMKPTLDCVEMCMSFIELPKTAGEAMSHAYMQRLFAVRLLMAVFAASDLGIPPPNSSAVTEVEREKMTMPEIKHPSLERNMPNTIYESLKNTTLLLLTSFLRRERLDNHRQAVGLAAFILHFLTLQAYHSVDDPSSLQSVRHIFSFLSYNLPEAAMNTVKKQLQLLQTAHIVEEADLSEYLATTTPIFYQSVRSFATLSCNSLPKSFLQSNLGPVMSRFADRNIQ
ncbi:YALI0E29029p [Yarrowia lipolytica CLIB122]|uniref:YALI0E29029p n=2 Tax=Yarrowia lipolytica TaxID=4952 RepID=Q6C479_YARLI|nr:YALI0E29029p [Yarrowia lipolytica CLIB122]AOW06114.1 hypothetical protein YALI1_E34319g [Yarrowia lipolytica]KAB8285612.1 hypothetical protein BKA91DRAFT_133345 [Yarrowia lipolytica]KAE8175300.1 hypothetical protein BKA90DRAFT_132425 [Yarrowia lipolytica]KAJ8057510.1 hypothetical protein LXG23DRAFT_54209 [Yarrowia lipolytica]QNP99862.1 Hypothetical protein YALI2_E01178g [Yarrowia lipolytica]|eukprot:XP_504533.1 YALI0E29029p [Yarrowia lipolytica CLIB122]